MSGLQFSILDQKQYSWIYCHTKTTIDLPDSIPERTEIAAAHRRASIKNLVIEGLESVLREETPTVTPPAALARLRQGSHLGGQTLTREKVHAR